MKLVKDINGTYSIHPKELPEEGPLVIEWHEAMIEDILIYTMMLLMQKYGYSTMTDGPSDACVDIAIENAVHSFFEKMKLVQQIHGENSSEMDKDKPQDELGANVSEKGIGMLKLVSFNNGIINVTEEGCIEVIDGSSIYDIKRSLDQYKEALSIVKNFRLD